MTIEDILELPLKDKSVLLLGMPGAGKTFIANKMKSVFPHEVIHTDTYVKGIAYNLPRAIYAAFEDLAHYNPSICEGVLGYHLLLEGYKRQSYFPDVVIEIKISAGKQREIYLRERDPEKLQYLKKFNAFHQGIMNEYHRLVPDSEKPFFLKLHNDYQCDHQQK